MNPVELTNHGFKPVENILNVFPVWTFMYYFESERTARDAYKQFWDISNQNKKNIRKVFAVELYKNNHPDENFIYSPYVIVLIYYSDGDSLFSMVPELDNIDGDGFGGHDGWAPGSADKFRRVNERISAFKIVG